MPGNSGTSDRLRAVLATLETLAEASLGTVGFRWEASPLGYAPLAGLAADPADHYRRRLKSAADRLFAPAVQFDTAQKPPHSWPPELNAAQGDKGPAASNDRHLPGKNGPGDGASRQRSAGSSVDRFPPPAAVPDQDMRPAPSSDTRQAQVADAVARILSRIAGHAQSGSDNPGSVQTTVLKNDPGPAGLPRRHPAEARLAAKAVISQADKTMRLDPISSEAASGANDPDAAKRDVPDRLHPSAATKQNAAFKPHRLGPSESDLPSVLGKTSMSRSGLASPVKLEKTVSANRLGAWANGAVNRSVQRSGMPRSQPSDAVSHVPKENSARGDKMIRPRESLAPAAAGIRETGTPGARSSLLERLVGQWRQAGKGASRPAPVRDLAPPQADARPLPLAPSTAQWPLSAVSDMDFVRRLESVLLSESRRHGIVVEDQ